MPPAFRRRAPDLLACLSIAILGAALGLRYGRMGFMPLDHSPIFDGGWRTLCGQVPFRDYHTASGIPPSLIQGGFFALLGVTWFAYVLHAALANALYGVLAYALLTRLGLARAAAWCYGALSTVVLFPPIGVPFMDAHAHVFSLAATALAAWAASAPRSRAEVAAWIAVPALALAAWGSKPTPSVAVPVLVALLVLRGSRREILRRAAWMAAGALIAGCVLLAAGLALGVDFERARTYLLEMPGEIGSARVERRGGPTSLLFHSITCADHLALASFSYGHALATGVLVLAGVRAVGARRGGAFSGGAVRAAALAEAFLLATVVHLFLTNNDPELGVGFLFVALGLAHLSIQELGRGGGKGARWAASAAGVLLVAVGARDAWSFDRRFNAPRIANDLVFDADLAERDAPDLPQGLSFLRWSVTASIPYSAADLGRTCEFLAGQSQGFVLIGDATILYGLAGKPSILPSLWFHPGVTIPLPNDPRFAAYEELLLESMRRHGVRFVVQEGERTWNHRKLADFQRLTQVVSERTLRTHQFGAYRVFELDPSWSERD